MTELSKARTGRGAGTVGARAVGLDVSHQVMLSNPEKVVADFKEVIESLESVEGVPTADRAAQRRGWLRLAAVRAGRAHSGG